MAAAILSGSNLTILPSRFLMLLIIATPCYCYHAESI
jgi:hypothetical protein